MDIGLGVGRRPGDEDLRLGCEEGFRPAELGAGVVELDAQGGFAAAPGGAFAHMRRNDGSRENRQSAAKSEADDLRIDRQILEEACRARRRRLEP